MVLIYFQFWRNVGQSWCLVTINNYKGREVLDILTKAIHSEDGREWSERGHMETTCILGRLVGYP